MPKFQAKSKNWFMLLAVRISSYVCMWEVWRTGKKHKIRLVVTFFILSKLGVFLREEPKLTSSVVL